MSGTAMAMMDAITNATGAMDHSMHANHSMHGDHSMHANHSMHGDHSMHANHSMHGDHVDHSMHNHGMNHSMNPDGNMSHDHGDNCMDHMGHGDHMGHMDMPGMKMYFHDGFNEYVLFKECETKSTEALIGACFVVFAVAVLYEGLKYFRESLLQRSLLQTQSGAHYVEGKHTPGSSHEQMVMQVGGASMSSRMLSGGHFVQTLLHMVQVFISYCLMLVFMTYNVWLCLAVVVGAGVGYFVFGWKRAVVVDTNEHCH